MLMPVEKMLLMAMHTTLLHDSSNCLPALRWSNEVSPLIYKLQLSNLINNQVDALQLRKLCNNNIIRFIIDRVVSTEDADYLVTKLGSLKPLQLSVDYNSTASQINADDRKDLSGIDVEQAIHDFIAMLEIENKQEIEQYCLQLYRKYRWNTSIFAA